MGGEREREERKVERTTGQGGHCQLGSCRATCEASSASASFYSDLLKLILKDASCLTPFVLRARPFVVPQVLLAAITHNDYVALLLGFSLVMIQLTAQLTNSAGKTLKQRGVESPLHAYLKFSPLSSPPITSPCTWQLPLCLSLRVVITFGCEIYVPSYLLSVFRFPFHFYLLVIRAAQLLTAAELKRQEIIRAQEVV